MTGSPLSSTVRLQSGSAVTSGSVAGILVDEGLTVDAELGAGVGADGRTSPGSAFSSSHPAAPRTNNGSNNAQRATRTGKGTMALLQRT
ncbi:hypothetical protein [Streptomyces sp. M92]|uniref:hypothetical protein n=1 Tax=Streptomyces sp. M92 TaxID=2944250 RepID=UPI00234BD299|nr:hypothetical protein [Streptomyces sp. M92]WCN02698.1 hypothetical protein M6G08_11745 [Streptomyces sp. M92]